MGDRTVTISRAEKVAIVAIVVVIVVWVPDILRIMREIAVVPYELEIMQQQIDRIEEATK